MLVALDVELVFLIVFDAKHCSVLTVISCLNTCGARHNLLYLLVVNPCSHLALSCISRMCHCCVSRSLFSSQFTGTVARTRRTAVGPQAHVPGHVDPQVLVVGPVVLRRQDDPNVMTLPDTAERHEQSAYLVALLNREINVDPVECQALALVDGLPNPNRAAR